MADTLPRACRAVERPYGKICAFVRALLEKNREGGLTEAENAKIDEIESLNHLFGRIKAQARRHVRAAA